jgi:hypothetical protein
MRTVLHSTELPVPKALTNMILSDGKSSDEDVDQVNNNMYCEAMLAGARSSSEPHLLTQGELNDIIHGLNLSKE